MYFDIKHIESVDEFGNRKVELQAVFTAPVYDDITPTDMSLTNQQKAGVKMERVTSRSRGNLETADKAESAMVSQIERLSEPSLTEPVITEPVVTNPEPPKSE